GGGAAVLDRAVGDLVVERGKAHVDAAGRDDADPGHGNRHGKRRSAGHRDRRRAAVVAVERLDPQLVAAVEQLNRIARAGRAGAVVPVHALEALTLIGYRTADG